MRVAIEKSTGVILEMQSHAKAGTLLANAVAAGISEADVEEREVTADEYAELVAAQPKSQEEIAAAALSALAHSDLVVLRCVEASVAIPAEWKAYRASLRAVVSGGGELPARPAFPQNT